MVLVVRPCYFVGIFLVCGSCWRHA